MDKNVTIEVRVLEAEASERTSSTSGEDTAGYAAQTPATMSQLFQVSPRVAVKLTLPDPAPEVTVNPGDVRGFMMKEKLKEPGDPDSAGYTNGAPIGWAFSFISDPFGTFVNVAVTGKP
jgi:hypothetical protein